MALQCPRCLRQYDVTLFQFGRSVRCDCGALVDLQKGHVALVALVSEPTPGLEFAPQKLPEGLSPTELILVRHAETDANRASRIQGQLDGPLNEHGRRQALDLAERFLDERPAAIYSSDLLRCRETAETIASELGIPVQETPLLREADFGQWEGKTAEEVREQFPDEYRERQRDPYSFQPPGGESKRQILDRVLPFLRELVVRHERTKVLVVTHGGPCTVVLHHVLGAPITARASFRVDNASIHRIEVGPLGWQVVTLNDTCHLKKPEPEQQEPGG